jgi:hypothetical protein
VLSIPSKKCDVPMTGHLSRAKLDASPCPTMSRRSRTWCSRRCNGRRSQSLMPRTRSSGSNCSW